MLLNCGAGEDSWRVPWTAKRSKQSTLKEINPEYSLERLMLKLKLRYFGHLMRRADSLEKTLMLGKIEGRRKRGQERRRWLDGITDSMDMSLSKLHEWSTGKPGVRQSVGSQRTGYDIVTEHRTTIILNKEKQLWKRNYSMWGGWVKWKLCLTRSVHVLSRSVVSNSYRGQLT